MPIRTVLTMAEPDGGPSRNTEGEDEEEEELDETVGMAVRAAWSISDGIVSIP